MTSLDWSDAFQIDEIGIETVIYGRVRIEAEYQPIFKRVGQTLQIDAFDGDCVATCGGVRIRLEELVGAGIPKSALESISCRLQISNFHYLAVQGAALVVSPSITALPDIGALIAHSQERAMSIGEAAIAPSQIILRKTEDADRSGEHQMAGMRTMLDVFDKSLSGHTPPKPDVVELRATLSFSTAREPVAVRLLKSLVAAHSRNGVAVLFSGIATQNQLRIAIDAEATLLAGPYLARSVSAGGFIDVTPLSINRLLGGRHSGLALIA